jgi:hypothetical protein
MWYESASPRRDEIGNEMVMTYDAISLSKDKSQKHEETWLAVLE